eukprot:467536-Prymnesium_polylepis.1
MLRPDFSASGSAYAMKSRMRPQKLVFFDLERRRSSSFDVRTSVSLPRMNFCSAPRKGARAAARRSTIPKSSSASEITCVSKRSSSSANGVFDSTTSCDASSIARSRSRGTPTDSTLAPGCFDLPSSSSISIRTMSSSTSLDSLDGLPPLADAAAASASSGASARWSGATWSARGAASGRSAARSAVSTRSRTTSNIGVGSTSAPRSPRGVFV